LYALVYVYLWRKLGRLLIATLVIALAATAIYALFVEMQSSRLQARLLSKFARDLHFKVEPGPSNEIRFPGPGPYDERLGYRQLPDVVERLQAQGYTVTAQARMSPKMIEMRDKGLFTPYREKDQAGLDVRDCRDESLFSARFPQRVYESFDAVPPLAVDALLFIENRELLDPRYPMRNAAIEWDRLGRAAADRAWRFVGDHASPGGSTLATQIEKYRHSPEGRTESVKEKFRQMASASLRTYLHGEYTLPWRRQLVVDYLNTVPLAAKAGIGEVNGLGDGLWGWYGRDFAEVNQLLLGYAGNGEPAPVTLVHRQALAFKEVLLMRQALAYKQTLSLLIAQRRPSHYLTVGEESLNRLTNSYLRVMADAGVIDPALRDAALQIRLKLRAQPIAERPVSFVERKAATAMRARLQNLLNVPRSYDLDRLDLVAATSMDGDMQRAAALVLRGLKDRATAKEAGLYGFRLLNEADDPTKLVYSFTLFERGDGANLLRVQADNHDQPLDINEGAKLDLGSTAKLRTLITYLELVAELHAKWGRSTKAQLAATTVNSKDQLARWALQYLSHTQDRSLHTMLEAAMERSYSANPGEAFYTGGGLHHFENFEPKDNGRSISVREALKHSVNLVFVRLMRDIVQHHIYRASSGEDIAPARRQELLSRFADKEGREFLARFYAKYHGKSRDEAMELLLAGVRAAPVQLATAFRSLEPDAGFEQFAEFLQQRLPRATPLSQLSDATLRSLYDRHGPDRLSLADRGYLLDVHPLELWLVEFLRQHAGATLGEVSTASRDLRQAVYAWLFRPSRKLAQDIRIRDMLEQDAFVEILRSWRRLGYPFESMTASYASAIGASGDRPAALAELMGIIVNRGERLPVKRIVTLDFARDTPYETRLRYEPPKYERVMPAAVAEVVRRSLIEVVQDGTARRLKGPWVLRDGSVVEIGGKTGTGDHRYDVHGKGGQLISSRVVNRTATFAFLIGDRHFGTVMAYVQGPDAAKYKFTSALPAQLLKAMTPTLMPMLGAGCQGATVER
jgi:membrane peptidoglycan carboxypeptidase